MKVTIISVVSLSKSQVSALSKAIQKKHPQEKLVIKQVIDPEVLGGVVVNLDSQSYDASLKAKLEALRIKLYQEL